MKNKINLMIFYADGRSRNIPFDVSRTLKISLVAVVALFFSGTGLTLYNYYRLSSLKRAYAQTLHDVTMEKPALGQRIRKLKDFEEKISFFLSGAVTDYGQENAAAMGQPSDIGMGSVESEPLEDEVVSQDVLEKSVITSFSLNTDESEDTGMDVAQLKDRLEKLAILAVKKKTRLDYTPSVRPVQGYISSTFGWRRSPFTGRRHYHRGIDIVNRIGTPVKATASGQVIFVGKEDFWGNSIFIKHINGMISKFGHLSSYEVAAGDSIHRGDIIGYVGMSGRSTGPHLHYQIEIAEQAVNPIQFIIEDYE